MAKTTGPRHRFNTTVARGTGFSAKTYIATAPGGGTYSVSSSPVLGGNSGEAGVCDDVVTPNFRTRVGSGEVINNPFVSIRSNLSFGGTGPINLFTGTIGVGQGFKAEYGHACTQWVTDYLMSPMAVEDYDLGAVVPDALRALLTTANTSALSNVDTSHAAALVSLGELNATFKMLINPLGALSQYMRRYRWRVRRGGKTVELSIDEGAGLYPCLANQYLTWYYGMKPFINDIQSILDAYVKSGYQPERVTARGGDSDSTTTTSEYYTGYINPTQDGRTWYRHKKTVTESLIGRSGILYEPSRLDWRKAYGFRVGDVPAALWDLTPWSFFFDYFGNFSKLIGAMSPRSGIRYLAAWEVGRMERTTRIETIDSGVGGSQWTHPRKGTEWAECTDKLCFRSPKSPYSGIGVELSLGNWESKTKVLAVVSLIIQQLSKTPHVIWRA